MEVKRKNAYDHNDRIRNHKPAPKKISTSNVLLVIIILMSFLSFLKFSGVLLYDEKINRIHDSNQMHVPSNISQNILQNYNHSLTVKKIFFNHSLDVIRSGSSNLLEITESSRGILRGNLETVKNEVRNLRALKIIMAYNNTAVFLMSKLQMITKCYLLTTFRPDDCHVLAIELQFPSSMLNSDEKLRNFTNNTGNVVLYAELVPFLTLPHSFFTVS